MSSIYCNDTKLLLGLIGAGIQASRMPAMLEREAAEHGLRCFYNLIDLDALGLRESDLSEILTAAERMGFSGVNVTHPCKQAILPLLNELSKDAEAIGAVNTVGLRGGKRIGHNTDWTGFRDGFLAGLPGAAIDHVVLLGAGGAGAAVAYALLQMGALRLTIIDPMESRRSELVERFASRFGRSVSMPRPTLRRASRGRRGWCMQLPQA